VVRVTADCPLYDPFVGGDVVRFHLSHGYDIVTNGGSEPQDRTWPRGLDTEAMRFAALERAHREARLPYQREHVTPYIYETAGDRAFIYKSGKDLSKHRWTLDTMEDWAFVTAVYERLYGGGAPDFFTKDVLRLLDREPTLSELNRGVEQKRLAR
jgi:spore coat polysaccharide biosynthesis protein SpsF